MIETVHLVAEATPVIGSESVETDAVLTEIPASTPLKSLSTEDVKQAILSLIRENNAEFKQLFAELMDNDDTPLVENEEEQTVETVPVEAVKKEPLDWREMPFWKAHPELKPIEVKPNPNKKKLHDAIMAFATNPETRLTDDLMSHELD